MEKDIAEAEIRRYESEPGESLESKRPLEWWRLCAKSKYLSKLAKKTLCNTATSVPSERIFSFAGNIVRKKRSCLSPNNVNCLFFYMKTCSHETQIDSVAFCILCFCEFL